LLTLILTWAPPLFADERLTFEKHVRPIFRQHCFDCHGATTEKEAGLDLRLVRLLVQGGESGAAITKGNAETSLLLQRVRRGEMPPGDHRVSEAQIKMLERWIREGAATVRPEPKHIAPAVGISEEERAYWAFQPIRRPPLPVIKDISRARTPLDTSLLAKLEPLQLTFADDADKTTLLRRAYLDLIGLPPSPESLQRFLSDTGNSAWDTVINQLLDSPHYGERWGRHWLDVAGYADSEGYSNKDTLRAWAYKYRDWVIRAFNTDLPFDQFITWQLAGDELTELPHKNLTAVEIDQLIATGFLRMAVDGTGVANDEVARNRVVTDTLKIVSSALLGLSVGCAQCHDHRYDPISHNDYHYLRAIFEPALNTKNWIVPGRRRISLYTEAEIAKAHEIEAEAQAKLLLTSVMKNKRRSLQPTPTLPGLLQDGLVQLSFGQQLFELGILLLQLLHPFRLVHAETAVFLPPADQRLFCNADLLRGYLLCTPLRDQHLGFTQLRDHLFRTVFLTSWHRLPS
jgi:hypothetical protein